ncbi:copper chaperone [Catenulispora sp. MAP5-51]|uniref:heavy-metal-associated domain-containing protein n=1 Tax=Catenulispora sp. MAP5-51 TaxID=3156298 RepID=UPI003511C2FC
MTAVAETGANTVPTTVAYGVLGMSCGHCSAAVTEALSALPGVHAVEIDLAGKRAMVTSDGPLEITAVRDAIEDAGYQLV